MNPNQNRSCGVLLPIFSLPGTGPLGSLGTEADRFADFLAACGFSWWQMLPITPVDAYHSPYSSCSAFAGEVLYIDLMELVEEGLLDSSDLTPFETLPAQPDRAEYEKARKLRFPLYQKAFHRYQQNQGGTSFRTRAYSFLEKNRDWLDDFALFRALANRFGTDHWNQWPAEYRSRNKAALEQVRKDDREKIEFVQFLQLVFDQQWSAFKQRLNRKNIRLLGDVPIYVGAAGAETWARPDLFLLDADGRMERVSGAPADSFNPDGQRWNSPLYRWDRLEDEGFDWWIRRIGKTLERFDAVRMDHFIGFYNFYSFPTAVRDKTLPVTDDEPTAGLTPFTPIDCHGGFWTKGPGEKLLDALFAVFPKEAFIAEDLGVVTQGVIDLRRHYHLPGMDVLPFSFDRLNRKDQNPIPFWPEESAACSGTHDTPTVLGWLESLRNGESDCVDYQFVIKTLWQYLPKNQRPKGAYTKILNRKLSPENARRLVQAAVRGILQSRCRLALFPVQDLLALDDSARMNTPGQSDGNWLWRLPGGLLNETLASALAEEIAGTRRIPAQ